MCGAPAGATLTVTASGNRVGESISSTPAGINVAVGSTASATFPVGTSITLRVSNGRTALWSGLCNSAAGRDTNTCTFTLNASGSETGNVQ